MSTPPDLLPALLRFFDEGPGMVLVCNADERVTHASQGFVRRLGLDLAQLQGRRPEEVLGGPSSTAQAWATLRRTAEITGRSVAQALVHGRNGEPLWCDLTLDLLRDADGHVSQWLLTLVDITQRRIQTELQERVLDAIVRDRPLAEVMALVCRQVESLTPDVVATVLAVDSAGRVHPLAGPSFPPEVARAFDGQPIGPAAGSCGTAAWRGTPVVVTDIATDPLWATYRDFVLPLGLHACWSSPIKNSAGRVLGTFAFYFHQPRGPNTLHQRLVEMSVHLCTLALEREQAHAHIHELAYYDSLTGLPNRALLEANATKAVARAQADSAPLGLLFIDLDRFKTINDTQGHAVGDAVLREVAQRLAHEVRHHDLISRLAGDEFVAVLPNCNAEQTRQTAERMLQALARPMMVADPPLQSAASIGVAMYPADGATLDDLMRHADMAMYQAKSAGRGRLQFFQAGMNQSAQERLQLETELRRALRCGELRLHYQPQIQTTPRGHPSPPRALFGVEALLRWQHPTLGEVSPARFIPVAEACGLIQALSHWVLNAACAQMADWQARGVAVPQVAVNLSAHDFHEPALAGRIGQLLRQYGLRGDQLTLELTETVLLDRRTDALRTLDALGALGVCLAMDDFGTGYSSLSHLHHLPIRQVKLDQSFVQDLDHQMAQALTSAVLHIGESLNLLVVAEGVETEAQARFLTERHCPVLQGFLLARPMAADQLEAWLAAYQAGASSAMP